MYRALWHTHTTIIPIYRWGNRPTDKQSGDTHLLTAPSTSVALLRARGHVRDNHPNAPFTSQMSARSPGRGMSGAQTPGALGYFQAFQPPPSGVSDSSNPLPSSAPSNHSKHCWGLDGLPGPVKLIDVCLVSGIIWKIRFSWFDQRVCKSVENTHMQ